MNDPVVIVGAARTPMGAFQGELKDFTASELGGVAIRAAVERAGIKPEDVDEVLGEIRTALLEADVAPALDLDGANAAVKTSGRLGDAIGGAGRATPHLRARRSRRASWGRTGHVTAEGPPSELDLTIRSAPGQGAVVTLRLPLGTGRSCA